MVDVLELPTFDSFWEDRRILRPNVQGKISKSAKLLRALAAGDIVSSVKSRSAPIWNFCAISRIDADYPQT